MATILLDRLVALAAEHGLMVVGHTDAQPLEADIARLAQWQSAGYAGDMSFMERAAEGFGRPDRFVSGARTVVTFAVRYSARPLPARPPGGGRVARYAWGQDYHVVLRTRLGALVQRLEAECGPFSARIFSDAVPLLERALAARSGLGFVGKNTLLIVPRIGSYTFLAEIVADLEIVAPRLKQVVGGCGTCFRCATQCPTGAIVAPFQLDARRCIAYLTIEKRSELSWAEREMIGEWIFGCDVCQDVCPFNHAPRVRGDGAAIDEFEPIDRVGPWLDLARVLELRSEGEFQRRFSGTALLRGRRKTLARNAAVVAANTGAVELTGLLAQRVTTDPSPLVRSHCLWAVWVLERRFGAAAVDFRALVDVGRRDPSDEVRREALRIGEEDDGSKHR